MTGQQWRSLADLKATQAQAAETLGANPPVQCLGPAGIPGHTAWLVGPVNGGGVLVLMRQLRPGAPASLRRRYRARIIANATGTCPRCTASVDLSGQRGQIAHEPTCSLVFTPRDSRWFEWSEQEKK